MANSRLTNGACSIEERVASASREDRRRLMGDLTSWLSPLRGDVQPATDVILVKFDAFVYLLILLPLLFDIAMVHFIRAVGMELA